MKKRYKKPEIIEFQQLTSQSMGQTSCGNGHNPVGNCNSGHNAIGVCNSGQNATAGACLGTGQNASGGECSYGQNASGGGCSSGQNASGGACSSGTNPAYKKTQGSDETCYNGHFPGTQTVCLSGHSDNSGQGEKRRIGTEERLVGNDGCEIGSSAAACFSGQAPGSYSQCMGGASPINSGCSAGYEATNHLQGCKSGTIPGSSDCNQGYDACANGGEDKEESSCFNGSFAGPEICEIGAADLMKGCLSGSGEEGCSAGNNPYITPCVSGADVCTGGYTPF